mmetsp:Transcript_111761/g.301474  ORF Transcript_111761/g.301474 Transcript_111761/m.301474 type:complete len:235 (-) Transcript_111761:344-1048(-)
MPTEDARSKDTAYCVLPEAKAESYSTMRVRSATCTSAQNGAVSTPLSMPTSPAALRWSGEPSRKSCTNRRKPPRESSRRCTSAKKRPPPMSWKVARASGVTSHKMVTCRLPWSQPSERGEGGTACSSAQAPCTAAAASTFAPSGIPTAGPRGGTAAGALPLPWPTLAGSRRVSTMWRSHQRGHLVCNILSSVSCGPCSMKTQAFTCRSAARTISRASALRPSSASCTNTQAVAK